jgi:hypothetical protein
MATNFVPQYSVTRVPLNVAPDITPRTEQMGYFHVIRFETLAGVPILDGEIRLSLGTSTDEFIPLLYNNRISFPQRVDRWRFDWDIQSDTVAIVLMSPDAGWLQLDTPNPKQLVTQAIGTNISESAVTVGVVAVQILPLDTNRQSSSIQNLGPAAIYIGSSAVTLANGTRLDPGDSIVINNTVAAVYGISAAAGNNVRTMTMGA